MKKAVILFLLALRFSLIHVKAQTGLNFDKRFVECEDKWVAFRAAKDSTYPYGFIYIDAQAGLTFHYEGNFSIGSDGKFIPKKLMDKGMYKMRLEPNNVKVAILPENRLTELDLPLVPDWLSIYKETKDTIGRMVRWGYFYNHWGESAKALTYLEKAYQINPKYKSLGFELSFAYNALEQYEKAVEVLENAIADNPDECLLYKEFSYAYIHLNQLVKADEACRKGIQQCKENKLKAEIAYNMTYTYYSRKDKSNFNHWSSETKKWAEADSIFSRNIALMEKELNK
jgi:tetratricopeptide (TPR) repeat protein